MSNLDLQVTLSYTIDVYKLARNNSLLHTVPMTQCTLI